MKALKNIQTKDRIAQAVREEILEGNIEPGEELAQETLAEMLGVSRMPVREALQTLVQEGFARRLPNRHIQAVVLDGRQIQEVFRMAATMEAGLIQMALERSRETEQEAEALKEPGRALESMKKAESQKEKARWEAECHSRLIQLADNPYLEQLQQNFMDGYVSWTLENLGGKEEYGTLLAEAVKALEEQNPEGIRKGLEQYYGKYAQALAERWKK